MIAESAADTKQAGGDEDNPDPGYKTVPADAVEEIVRGRFCVVFVRGARSQGVRASGKDRMKNGGGAALVSPRAPNSFAAVKRNRAFQTLRHISEYAASRKYP